MPLFTLFSEDFLIDSSNCSQAIFSFVGASHNELVGKAIKPTSDDSRMANLNFEEPKLRYKGTIYK